MLEKGTYGTIAEIAAAEKINESYVGRVLRLTLLAPDIVEAVLNGRQPGGDDTGGVDATVSGGVEGATSEVPQLRPIIRSTGDVSITKLQALSAASPGTPLDAREPAWCPSGLLFPVDHGSLRRPQYEGQSRDRLPLRHVDRKAR
jgi:hypothetical protein